ncbi:unnamed protein product [Caenorhabditis nigoni]
MLEASPHCSARRILLTKKDEHGCNQWRNHNNQGHNNTVDSPTKSLTEPGISNNVWMPRIPSTIYSQPERHHGGSSRNPANLLTQLQRQQVLLRQRMFIGSQRFRERSQDSRKVNTNWMRTRRRRSPDAISIFVERKAHQVDRSSKEVEGPETKVKMTHLAPEVRKTGPASQMDRWTTNHDYGLAIGISVKIGIPKSTTFGQYAVTKRRRSRKRQGQSSHVLCQAGHPTRGVKTTQVKQTVTTRRSTRPERSVKRAWFRNLLMTTPQECRTQQRKPIKESRIRYGNTDSSHNVQGSRSRQDYPINSQPRRFTSNRSLQQLHFKDSHDASILKISYHKNTPPRELQINTKFQLFKDPGRPSSSNHEAIDKPKDKSRTADQVRKQPEALKEFRCPATQDNQHKSLVDVRKSNRPIQSSERPMSPSIQCQVARHSTKDSDQLITRPQAAEYNDSAKSNYTAKYSYRAKHNCKVQFSSEESRSRPYLPRQVRLNAFGTELSSNESARQDDGSTTPFPPEKGFFRPPPVSRPLPRARPDNMSPKGACAIVLREQTHSCAVYRTARVKARWSRLAEGFIVNVDGSSTSFLVSKCSTPNETCQAAHRSLRLSPLHTLSPTRKGAPLRHVLQDQRQGGTPTANQEQTNSL